MKDQERAERDKIGQELIAEEKFSIEEISQLLNTNSNTIKTRLHRARGQLKAAIEGEVKHSG